MGSSVMVAVVLSVVFVTSVSYVTIMTFAQFAKGKECTWTTTWSPSMSLVLTVRGDTKAGEVMAGSVGKEGAGVAVEGRADPLLAMAGGGDGLEVITSHRSEDTLCSVNPLSHCGVF